MQHECCGQRNAAEHKSQDNSEIMQMSGRMDGKTPAVCEEVNKIWNCAPLFLNIIEKINNTMPRCAVY